MSFFLNMGLIMGISLLHLITSRAILIVGINEVSHEIQDIIFHVAFFFWSIVANLHKVRKSVNCEFVKEN